MPQAAFFPHRLECGREVPMRPVTRKLKKKNNRNIFFFPHTNFDYGRGLAVRFVS